MAGFYAEVFSNATVFCSGYLNCNLPWNITIAAPTTVGLPVQTFYGVDLLHQAVLYALNLGSSEDILVVLSVNTTESKSRKIDILR